ncbi:single-stranded DNA-binding protein [Arthrobacter sp. UM1]|uniref:single-stranded DNA-binding protein n=1 Tax=Arthrobacter sp. UM1 TaxID=2766776 RepID=UPI001CF62756|nr:single-stranded DNA-binding protein [Arthrobacter sp. UM1]MCB4207354.1 single-stranded DNA-binding protein [Arthrobacter sp. UM1]
MSNVTLYGTVGTSVESGTTATGHPTAQFRLALNHRYFQSKSNEWITGPTSWVTVLAYRRLAQNLHTSVGKGDRVIVTGRLSVREWQAQDGSRGRTVEIVAESVGPDLRFMTCNARKADSGADLPGHSSAQDASAEHLASEHGGDGLGEAELGQGAHDARECSSSSAGCEAGGPSGLTAGGGFEESGAAPDFGLSPDERRASSLSAA